MGKEHAPLMGNSCGRKRHMREEEEEGGGRKGLRKRGRFLG